MIHDDLIQIAGQDVYAQATLDGEIALIPEHRLQQVLQAKLGGQSLAGLPLRTRSKRVKELVCAAMGYQVPTSFKKVKPGFPAQQLDIYIQKSLNLQLWNEGVVPERRYAFIQVSGQDIILKVKVLNGVQLAEYEKSGTWTSKYQASLSLGLASHELISSHDTAQMMPHISARLPNLAHESPAALPVSGSLLPITMIYNRLAPLVGSSFADPGRTQERNRGAALHELACKSLGYTCFEENGQFPDIRHQLLELKLQTSPTIDLGVMLPDSFQKLNMPVLGDHEVRVCDTRYAIFYAETDGKTVHIKNLYVCTGTDFFTKFRRFEGKVQNRKLQIHLPSDFFST